MKSNLLSIRPAAGFRNLVAQEGTVWISPLRVWTKLVNAGFFDHEPRRQSFGLGFGMRMFKAEFSRQFIKGGNEACVHHIHKLGSRKSNRLF